MVYRIMKLTSKAGIVDNPADKAGDNLSGQPAATIDLREQTLDVLLNAIRNPGNTVVKVGGPDGPYREARGYMTLERFLRGKSPRQFEAHHLGMKAGTLRNGCRIYYPNPMTITKDNIGPRYMTSWSAGVSPRDLDNLSQEAGEAVNYHPDYPPASEPIPQFVIFRRVPVLRQRFLAYDELL